MPIVASSHKSTTSGKQELAENIINMNTVILPSFVGPSLLVKIAPDQR